MNFVQEQLQLDVQVATLQWNFDFQNGVPLPGPMMWEPITSDVPPAVSNAVPADLMQPAENESEPEAGLMQSTQNESEPEQMGEAEDQPVR